MDGIQPADARSADPGVDVATDPPLDTSALVAEAAKKSKVCWVQPAGGDRPRAAWYLWADGALLVLTGPGEQALPGLAGALHAEVTLRSKENGARLVRTTVAVHRVHPGTEDWDAAVPLLVGARLNLPDGEAAVDRWARECAVVRLTPTGAVAETALDPDPSSHAAPPPPTPATTRVPKPFRLHRVRAPRRLS